MKPKLGIDQSVTALNETAEVLEHNRLNDEIEPD